MSAKHLKYRPEIDGLRALAVLSVVFYHAFPDLLPGGFIGVDVFFVISGYLITKILIEQLAAKRFSILDFYSRRIRRIFPSLLLVLAAVLGFGWISLFPDEYALLGKHVAAGAAFVSNIVLWTETGYFDAAADSKPLLHLWSLAIEEQFYLVWPILLWLIWRFPRWRLKLTIVFAILSFGLNVIMISKTPAAVFYLPFTRGWELLLGAILAFSEAPASSSKECVELPCSNLQILDKRSTTNFLSLLGFSLLFVGMFVINKQSLFPGWWALFPTVGAVALIKAGRGSWLNTYVLSNRHLVYIGLISYPIYLWHWPLLSFLRIITSGAASAVQKGSAVFLSIIFAAICYWAFERWFRKSILSVFKCALLISTMTAIGCTGFYIYDTAGLPDREVVRVNPDKGSGFVGGSAGLTIDECGLNKDIQSRFANCKRDNREKERFALIGDSKAAALFDGLIRTSSDHGRWLFIGGNGPYGPPVPVISDDKIYAVYQDLSRPALNAVANNANIETVALVFGARSVLFLSNDYSIEDLPTNPHFSKAKEGLLASVNLLLGAKKNVVLVIDNPTLPDPKDCIARKTTNPLINQYIVSENPACRLALSRQLELSSKYRAMLEAIRLESDSNRVSIFDPTSVLCEPDDDLCLPYKNGHLLYSYTDHISDYAAGLVGTELNRFVGEKQSITNE